MPAVTEKAQIAVSRKAHPLHPVTKPGHPTAIGVSLIMEEDREEIQFYEITSAVKGYGSKMVEAVLNALPKKWEAIVVMDWSGGF